MLNERELATAIVLAMFVVAGLANPKTRAGLLSGFAAVGKALWNRHVIGVLLAYFAWVSLCVLGASAIGLWQLSLLKDTILSALVVGLPLLFRALNNKSGGLLLRNVAKEALGLSAFVAFYVNLSPLPLWAEILLQMVLILLVLMQVAVQRIDPSTGQKAVSGCVNFALVALGIGLITWSTIRLVTEWTTLDQKELFLQLFMAVWLPLALFPFLYGFAYVAAVEGILSRISRLNDDVDWREKAGILVGLSFSLRTAKAFSGPHLRLTGDRTFLGAVDHARNVKDDLDRREAKALDQVQTLDALAGAVGADSTGAQLDRREFNGTKKALRWLHTCQSGWYERQGNRFWGAERTDDMLRPLSRYELPDDHGVVVETTPDRTRWRGWRILPSGWVLGIGATDRTSEFLYAGPARPSSWPGDDDVWIDAARQEWPADWDRNDEIAR
ncbi:hypothetical protein DEU37_2761 [Microbacterium sp. AG790]|uniref:hypothetical protein n=1 Tax=Microbacterium sp. AG790 TaxID=2183995 RepID=UPI000F23B034|nr:hypothetical protein [Microbacterium sp. AG790]RKS85295.1 hypothetical protein DEU37_2761 [Microbacterium sp. AG790]